MRDYREEWKAERAEGVQIIANLERAVNELESENLAVEQRNQRLEATIVEQRERLSNTNENDELASANSQLSEAESRNRELEANHSALEQRKARSDEAYETRLSRFQEQVHAETERVATQWHERIAEIRAELEAIQGTDLGHAQQAVTTAEARASNAERAQAQAEQQMRLAETKAREALASVEGTGRISVDDPRIAWIWRKSARLATRFQFCSEYDKIAEAMGVPEHMVSWTGYAEVEINHTVTVPISGTSSRSEMANGNQDYEISPEDVLKALQNIEEVYNWRVQDVEINSSEDDGDSEGDDTEGL